jgi:hypothetical protein
MPIQSDWLRYVLVTSFALATGLRVAAAATVPVTICHFPPDDPADVQVVTVGAPAVAAHVALHNDAVCAGENRNCCFGGSSRSVCTNFAADVDNCGGCGVVCSTGELCISGACVGSCAPGEAFCGGVCVNPDTDPNNCGACGTVCASGEACVSGACATNPNPECADSVCGNFIRCNLSACGGNGVCSATTEGGGICVNSLTQCAGLTPCATSADCPQGALCGLNSCCGPGFCVPTFALCQ